MAELIRYLLLANLFLLLLSLFFKLILEKEKWFRFNRTVLIGGVLLALIIPVFQLDLLTSPEQALIVIPEMIVSMPAVTADIILDEIQIVGTAPKVFPWISMTQIAYIVGIIFTGLLFTWRLGQIKLMQRSNPMKLVKDLFITILPSTFSAFSFGGVVYFPGPLNPEDETTSMILEHERAHVNQKHSWDIIFIEIVKILFFYNPAAYSLKKQMELTHEYLADSVGASSNTKLYSMALFKSFFQVPGLALSHGFNSASTLKQRITMLGNNEKKKFAGFRYFLLLPLAISFLTLSAFTTVKAEPKKDQLESSQIEEQYFAPTNSDNTWDWKKSQISL